MGVKWGPKWDEKWGVKWGPKWVQNGTKKVMPAMQFWVRFVAFLVCIFGGAKSFVT
jgi:hypothetical protein